MFGLSVATEIFQGSTERTWNCVLHFIHLIWTKLNHIRQPIMPRSRKRHHSHSRSRSRSHDRSREREEKHRKNESHEKDRDGKRRKIESYDSPQHKRSVSSEPDWHDEERESPPKDLAVDEDNICKDQKSPRIKENDGTATKKDKTNEESDHSINEKSVAAESDTKNEDKIEILDDDDDEKSCEDAVVILNSSKDEIAPSKEGSTLINKLEITPKKVLSPKLLRKKAESEKKRQEKQKEKEEREKKRNEERERIQQEKLKKKEEKQKELEQKHKEREMKEEQKKKEREEKEELRKREREEKEQKRKQKEEQKRKEREQEKLKKQLEIEEKNKEKQKEEEKKQKAAAAFVNFFVAKKTDNLQEEKKMDVTQPSAFMAFQVKSDMKLPPTRRKPLSEIEKEALVHYFENQDETASYIKDLKSGKPIRKSFKTWPFEEVVDDDVTIIEGEGNLGETIHEDKSELQKFRAKCLKFHENRRPAYFGTWRKKSNVITPRRPFAEDEIFNYEEDSDDDWEEEEQGESLNGSDDEVDKENEDEKDDYEVDNEFFVPHGHLSDDEVDDEETSRLSPESLKQKLKLLKDEFEHDMQSKTHKLKPRSIGCVWYNKDGSNVEEAINRYLQPLAMMTNGPIQIKKREEILISNTGSRKPKPPIELNPEHIPMFLRVIHGNTNKKRVLVEQFMTHMANNGFTVDIKKTTLVKHLKKFATWRRCKKNGPMKNKFGWFVNEDVEKEYELDLALPNILESDNKK